MRVLVTGAGGFVGRNLVPVLVAEGFHVVGVMREPSPSVPMPQSGPGSFTLVAGDLTQGLDLTQSVDVVVHAASKLSVDTSVSEDAHILNNALATQRLIDDVVSAGARQLIFLSSILVYGEIEVPVVDEATAIQNPGAYGRSKLLAEKALQDVSGKLPSVSLRLPGIIGVGAHRTWLVRCVEAMMRNQPVEVFDCNGAFNNAVHVKDLCRFIVTLIRAELSGSEILTLGSEGVMSISMATERLLRGLGSGSEIIESESKKPAFSISIEKARKHFGYAPMDTETMLDHYAQEMLGATSQRVSGLA